MIDLIRMKTPLGNRDNYEDVEILPAGNNEQDNRPNVTRIVWLIILYMIPFSLIAYGIVHLHDCPAQNMLPVAMIVLGGIALLTRLVSSPTEFRWAFRSGDGVVRSLPVICLNLLLQIILLCWFFAVCFWVYSMKPDTKSGSPDFCDEYFFRGAFWGCTVGLIFFSLFTMLICGAGCWLACNE